MSTVEYPREYPRRYRHEYLCYYPRECPCEYPREYPYEYPREYSQVVREADRVILAHKLASTKCGNDPTRRTRSPRPRRVLALMYVYFSIYSVQTYSRRGLFLPLPRVAVPPMKFPADLLTVMLFGPEAAQRSAAQRIRIYI